MDVGCDLRLRVSRDIGLLKFAILGHRPIEDRLITGSLIRIINAPKGRITRKTLPGFAVRFHEATQIKLAGAKSGLGRLLNDALPAHFLLESVYAFPRMLAR